MGRLLADPCQHCWPENLLAQQELLSVDGTLKECSIADEL